MWPIYVFYTNDSKYLRATPTMHRCHHLAYLPSLPPDFQEKYANEFGYMASQDVITHCKRELIQEYWRLILDDEFMDAFENGIVMTCADGVTRRIFPRPFTYSADYPEKVSLTCVRTMGLCSCIRCTTTKVDFIKTATIHDMNARKKLARIDNEDLKMKVEKARKFIYERGKKIHSEEVENQLKPLSLTPTRNAFSERFSKFGFNYFEMFVPDFMHEIELGIWKHLFIHLLRLLYAVGGDGIQILNKRYRDVPTFGNGTIRRFNENASALKKLAARDYEDLLLCSIPIFDGLFPPPHDKYVSELLHAMSTWHSLAKLRQHTDSTLEHLRVTTSDLWRRLRQFLRTTCTVYVTKELPKEEAARGRRKAALSSKKPTEPTNNSTRKTDSTRKEKLLNLLTYKFHSSADYVETIRRYGTTDSYSTQTGELEHCRLKKWYLRTNKTNAAAHVAIREQRERTLRAIDQNYNEFMHNLQNTEGLPNNDPEDGNYSKHHLISKRKYTTINLTEWLDNNRNDLAFENFLPRLKDHILMRLLDQCDPDIQYSDYQHSTVTIVKNVLYSHKTVRINYTTYDGCRAQDCLSARKMSDVMVLSREDQNSLHQNPYWYARIIGIFHVNVLHTASASHPNQPQSLEIVWVRWFGSDPGFKAGFKEHRLPRIGFVPTDSDDPFGFISPEDIIRGVHLIPAFAYGYTDRLLSQDTVSIARHPLKRRHDNSNDMNVDWVNYYVNIFVDRDMFMRFRGGGISHRPDQVANSDVDTQIEDELEDFDDELLENLFAQQDQDLDDEDILENGDLTDDDDEDNENISDRESSDEDEQDDSGHARVANAVEDLGFDIL